MVFLQLEERMNSSSFKIRLEGCSWVGFFSLHHRLFSLIAMLKILICNYGPSYVVLIIIIMFCHTD